MKRNAKKLSRTEQAKVEVKRQGKKALEQADELMREIQEVVASAKAVYGDVRKQTKGKTLREGAGLVSEVLKRELAAKGEVAAAIRAARTKKSAKKSAKSAKPASKSSAKPAAKSASKSAPKPANKTAGKTAKSARA